MALQLNNNLHSIIEMGHQSLHSLDLDEHFPPDRPSSTLPEPKYPSKHHTHIPRQLTYSHFGELTS